MPSLIGSLFVSLTADFAPFQRSMQSAESVVTSTSTSIRRNMGLTEQSVTSMSNSMNSGIKPYALISAARTFDTVQQRANILRGALFATTAAFGGLGAALTTNVVSRYLDSFLELSNQVRVVSSGTADLTSQMSALQQVAERSRSSLTAVGLLYSRLSKTTPDDGPDKMLRRVETINKALQLGGATSQESASAAIQFSQGIQTNKFGGNDLRAVLETPLGGYLAKGLGVTIGKMREMSAQGDLTAKVVFAALDKVSAEVDQKFNKSVVTMDQALTVADGKLVMFAGTLNDTYGFTRILAGAISSFGNNLSSIIPMLGNAALLFGTMFAGRGAAALGDATFGNIVRGIQSVTAARKDDLRVAAEANEVAQGRVQTARGVLQTATHASTGDVTGLAPKQDVKAYQRDSAALVAADQKHLDLLNQKAVVTQQLGEIYRTATVGEIKAAQAIADAEQNVNDKIKARTAIKGQVTKNANQLALYPQPTGKTPGYEVLDKRATLLAQQEVLVKQLGAAEAQVGAARDAIEAKNVKLIESTNVSYAAAAKERAAILMNEKRLEQELAASTANRDALAGKARTSKGAVLNSGGIAAAAAVTDATGVLSQTEMAANRTSLALELAAKEAGVLSLGFGLVKTAGASLLGFLGGPWGAAFTVAIGFLTYLGASAAETAQKILLSQQAIDEALANIESQVLEKTPNQALALIDSKIDATKVLISRATDGLVKARDDIANNITGEIFTQISGGDQFNKISAQFDDLMNRFRTTKMSVSDLRAALIQIGADPAVLDKVLSGADDARLALNKATQAAQYFQDQLDKLEGKRINIVANIDVNDPMGILTRGLTSLQAATADATGQGGFDSAEMVKNANRLKLMQEEQRRKDDAAELARAANSRPQKIEDKAQQLFTDGSGRSLDDSRALATKIVQLQEMSKASKSAAKDYENFAHKLAELVASSQGVGMTEIDTKVINFAKSLKDGSAMITQYINAVKSGDLGEAPKQLLQARDAFIALEAASTSTSILQKYGDGAQLANEFAMKQNILNKAVADGSITALQAGAAYADFLSQFGNYQWIDQLSSAITNFSESAIFDFANIGTAARSLVTEIGKIIIQATLLKPLQEGLNSIFGGFATGGLSLGSLGGGGDAGANPGNALDLLTGFTFHTGTMSAGTGGPSRTLPAAAWAGAPRFHTGLKANELTAILEKGESVLRQRDMSRTVGLVGGMTKQMSQGGGSGGGSPTIQIIDQAGVKKTTQQSTGPNGDSLTRIILETVAGGAAGGQLDNAFGSRFGVTPKTTRR
jgi:tape measure domain-containing protein